MARFLGNGRYVLGEQLGVGGMGAVYAAEDLVRTEQVAIKIANCDHVAFEVIDEHMARELRVGAATHHPNVVTVLGGGSDGGQPFVVMELAPGRTLSLLAAADRLSIRRVGAIVDQILAGLGAIHGAGYVHGDLKTDNVLVTPAPDGSDLVKIIDLGLACEQGRASPIAGGHRIISGTPQYLAPELALGGAKTVASEIYAVGVILYELLTGSPPFSGGGDVEILRMHVEDAVLPPSLRSPELRLSLALERVVLRSLHKDPRARYASATEFRCALRVATRECHEALLAGHAAASTGSTDSTRPELPSGRLRALGVYPPAMVGGA